MFSRWVIPAFLVFCWNTHFSFCSERASSIDWSYRKSRQTHKSNISSQSLSPGIDSYSRVFSKTIGSECRMYPSDSVYARELLGRCPSITSLWKVFARVAMEGDAYAIYPEYIVRKNYTLFPDLSLSCDLLD